MTADPRDALVNAMLPFATELACQVHDWNAEAVAQILAPLNEQGKDALIVALAALIPVDHSLRDLVAWTHEPTKHCPRCDRRKPPTEFHRNRSTPDGLHVWCKACHLESKRKPALHVVADGERRAS